MNLLPFTVQFSHAQLAFSLEHITSHKYFKVHSFLSFTVKRLLHSGWKFWQEKEGVPPSYQSNKTSLRDVLFVSVGQGKHSEPPSDLANPWTFWCKLMIVGCMLITSSLSTLPRIFRRMVSIYWTFWMKYAQTKISF